MYFWNPGEYTHGLLTFHQSLNMMGVANLSGRHLRRILRPRLFPVQHRVNQAQERCSRMNQSILFANDKDKTRRSPSLHRTADVPCHCITTPSFFLFPLKPSWIESSPVVAPNSR